jgi:protein-disulfide isomerase
VDSGKANYSFKHLAFLGPESVYAAVAAECAADQGKFWQYHDTLFEHQAGENQGAFEKEKLIAFGSDLGLDATRFEKCVSSDETIARVQADSAEAEKFGVGSTPTFFVNGRPLVGLKSPAEFSAAIEAALNP